MFDNIKNTIKTFNPALISSDRKKILDQLVQVVNTKWTNEESVTLNFICTHNSRRSHLAQVWAQTMAFYFDVKNVFAYSGGTEATALFPMVKDSLIKIGFKVKAISEGTNPVYMIKYAANEAPIIGFSKVYNDDFNPTSGFCSIMTCSSANDACPLVSGASARVALTFEDPKVFDGTPEASKMYHQRSLEIGQEMYYVFSNIENNGI